MILTEIIKYSEEELLFIEFWNSCKWVYWDKCPKSIFLVREIEILYRFRREKITEKECVIEIDWKGKNIKLNSYSSELEFFLDFELNIEFSSDKLEEIILNSFNDLILEAKMNIKKKKLIDQITLSNKSKKNKNINEQFKVVILQWNSRLAKLENYINNNITII